MYDLKCDQCGKEFTRKMRPYRGKNVFCSAVCGQRFHAGKKSDTSFGFEEDRMGRDCILIELSADYCEMARRRVAGDAGLFGDVA